MTPSNEVNTASVHQKQPLAKVAISVAVRMGFGFMVVSAMGLEEEVWRSFWAQAVSPINNKLNKKVVLFISGVKFRVLCRF
jgi:hypothetical protein